MEHKVVLPGWPDDTGVRLGSDPLEELCRHLAELRRVHHHQLQLPPVHTEPLARANTIKVDPEIRCSPARTRTAARTRS